MNKAGAGFIRKSLYYKVMSIDQYKKTHLRFLVSSCAAGGALILLYFYFSGPRLGPLYDYLMLRRSPPLISREVAIIDAGPGSTNFIEPAAAIVILTSLIELDARALAIQIPILGKAGSASPAENGFSDRIDEEFTVLSRNIENLFQAILMGSVSPEEAERYVDVLLDFSRQGKERLLSALPRGDDPEIQRMEQAAAAFGSVLETGDVYFSSVEKTDNGSVLYSRLSPDPDGVFRRVYPLRSALIRRADISDSSGAEHIVYALLNQEFGTPDIEYRNGLRLLRFKREGFSRDIALDSRGALLVERPRGGEDFKRLSYEAFMEYERADRKLALFLDTLREQGCFAYLAPEAYPTILYNYSHRLLEELLENTGDTPVEDLKARWLDSRIAYLRSLENFITGPSEVDLIMSYEQRIAPGNIETAELRRLVSLRNSIITAFAGLREKYDEFLRSRSGLSAALAGSFCILGPANFIQADSGDDTPPSSAEASALLANAILSGRSIVPLPGRYVLSCSLAIIIFILFLIKTLSPALTLAAGLSMTVLTASAAACVFIFTPYWFDPFIPAGSAMAGTVASFLYIFYMKHRDKELVLRLYRGAAGPVYLKELVHTRRPGEREMIQAGAAIVAVRNGKLLATERTKIPQDSAWEIRAFRETAARIFREAGGAVVGMEGDLTLIAFGSPLERIALESVKAKAPCNNESQTPDSPGLESRAARFIIKLLRETPEAAAWRFGLDVGDCVFGYSEIFGYAAFGPPVVKARILSGLASRCHARILISAKSSESLDVYMPRKLGAIADAAGKEKEIFYEIPIA
ncbi:MAG: hypothetical protein LBU18_02670 [Treponema sp.]|jgi:hypothetical protein|nr:hypothetical protein [Treponema sp.]